MKNSIPIFRWSLESDLRSQYHKYVDQILDEGFLTNHSFVDEFEKKFKDWNKSSYATAVSNGTAALEVIFHALELKNKKIIIPSNTFVATAAAAIQTGAEPLILDIEDKYFGLCPKELKKNITSEIGAVVVQHTGGLISPAVLEIQKICEEMNVPLIEDAAHAIGSNFAGIRAGNFGEAGAFSLFTTKIMTTGEGGLAVCRSPELYDKIYSARRFGVSSQNPLLHENEGANYKLNEFSAALGCIELDRINERIQKRKAISDRYKLNLKGSSYKVIVPPENGSSSFYKQIIIPPFGLTRDSISAHLQSVGISLTGGVYFKPLHRQPRLIKYVSNKKYPVSEQFANTHICPPCYPELNLIEVDKICEELIRLASNEMIVRDANV